jgi:hypothetical protein
MSSDEELTDRWEAGPPLGRPVGHADRVRIARVLIGRHGLAEATTRLQRRISENCRAAGVPERFDAELTRRWAAAIAGAMDVGDADTFDEFVTAHPALLQPNLLGLPAWMSSDILPSVADDEAERPLYGGWVTTGVVRVGETVRRPRGRNAVFVERLLRRLEEAGFDAAPRFLGIDGAGRQMLTFVAGDVPSDCRDVVWRDEQVAAIACLLHRYHEATAGTDVADGAEVVCHNDFGPWNLVWRNDLPVAIIDYDNAAPGNRLDDLGYAVWKTLNLGLVDIPLSEQRRRAKVFAASYGVRVDSPLLDAIERAQTRMRDLIAGAPAGSARDDALAQNQGERHWFEVNGLHLID